MARLTESAESNKTGDHALITNSNNGTEVTNQETTSQKIQVVKIQLQQLILAFNNALSTGQPENGINVMDGNGPEREVTTTHASALETTAQYIYAKNATLERAPCELGASERILLILHEIAGDKWANPLAAQGCKSVFELIDCATTLHRRRPREKAQAHKGMHKPATSTQQTTSALTNAPSLKSFKHTSQRNCLNCDQPSHFSRDGPEPKTTATICAEKKLVQKGMSPSEKNVHCFLCTTGDSLFIVIAFTERNHLLKASKGVTPRRFVHLHRHLPMPPTWWHLLCQIPLQGPSVVTPKSNLNNCSSPPRDLDIHQSPQHRARPLVLRELLPSSCLDAGGPSDIFATRWMARVALRRYASQWSSHLDGGTSDVLVYRGGDGSMETAVYRKPYDTGNFLSYNSHNRTEQKRSVMNPPRPVPGEPRALEPQLCLENPSRLTSQPLASRAGGTASAVQGALSLQSGVMHGAMPVKTEGGQLKMVNVGPALNSDSAKNTAAVTLEENDSAKLGQAEPRHAAAEKYGRDGGTPVSCANIYARERTANAALVV
ncbi:hypothetical protein HPB47_022957 [Ixodes persulcatus]|uniref:Uncharacterized protein n=1 Tax=Ixodes persulcatus TaxID=34615 RepID=A0AC60QAI7_IXOPE|nr:hypothetical protein HPB47_022957 [Ixodes persulcatus]